MSRGAIRLRSNVVLEALDRTALDRAWHLVPGEIVETYRTRHLEGPLSATQRQRDENGVYISCALCRRPNHQIAREGCADSRCPAPRPDSAEVARNRARHHEALELMALEREHLTAEDHDEEPLVPIIAPEAAVERLLGPRASVSLVEETPARQTTGSPGQAAARAALSRAAAQTGRFTDGYCVTPVDNLVETLTLGQARRALSDLAQGDGSELEPRAALPPKFCAAYSSAALAVNTFGAWIGNESWLQIAGKVGFANLEFETKFPTGLQGRAPNLDVYISGPSTHVAIESKCTEHLGRHSATFQESYDAKVDEIAHPSWQAVFACLKSEPETFSRVDVGQLVRHYLGLRRAVSEGRVARTITLLYLFWQPGQVADDEGAASDHAREIVRLTSAVDDPMVPFAALSYQELWAQWSARGAPPWLLEHVAALRARYDVAAPAETVDQVELPRV